MVRTVTAIPSTTVVPSGKMTYEEFLEWADEDTHAEWVDGEVIPMSPVSVRHQDIGGLLHAVMKVWIETHQLGTLLYESFQMKTSVRPSGREPDLLFVSQNHHSRLQDNYLDGPADLIVEIVSPESIERDQVDKFGEYEQAGVEEYWLIDPLRRQAEFYQRGADGFYHPTAIGSDGRYESRVLHGLWINVNWFWQTPLPSVLSVLRGWDLI